jgi:NAD(P)-dependent dehydrogenase (short-subunit alcohol dehydrogenase family)
MPKEVWIVGASQGLGLSVARQYAGRGRRVVGMSRSSQPVDGVFNAWRQVDVTDAAAFDAAISALYAEDRAPAVVIYMAAMLYQGPLIDEPDLLLRREVDTNYLGFVRLCQAVARHKPADQSVRLVATASTLGYVGCPSLDSYSATKAALISFARSARSELSVRRIAIQVISPPHMIEGGADLTGPQRFSQRWVAPRFVRSVDRGTPERLLGFSNRALVGMSRLARSGAQNIMNAIGTGALRRGAQRSG